MHLSPMGLLFTLGFTCVPTKSYEPSIPVLDSMLTVRTYTTYVHRYSGFVCLALAVMWNANIVDKLAVCGRTAPSPPLPCSQVWGRTAPSPPLLCSQGVREKWRELRARAAA